MKKFEEIKNRLKEDGIRYWSNDNISKYIDENDKQQLIDETAEYFELVWQSLLIDTETDPNSKGTAKRLSKMYWNELFSGRYNSQPDVTSFPNYTDEEGVLYNGMITVRADIKSVCSHHSQPVNGTCYIGIIPGHNNVLGLSKYIRIAQWHARRGTLQEELTTRIANHISELTGTEDVAVYIQATHGCCENRGVGAHNSLTQTTVLKGQFMNDSEVKKEFMDNIKIQNQREAR